MKPIFLSVQLYVTCLMNFVSDEQAIRKISKISQS